MSASQQRRPVASMSPRMSSASHMRFAIPPHHLNALIALELLDLRHVDELFAVTDANRAHLRARHHDRGAPASHISCIWHAGARSRGDLVRDRECSQSGSARKAALRA